MIKLDRALCLSKQEERKRTDQNRHMFLVVKRQSLMLHSKYIHKQHRNVHPGWGKGEWRKKAMRKTTTILYVSFVTFLPPIILSKASGE
jgi:hypothetical protein